jgi:conjugative transposon TraM protein
LNLNVPDAGLKENDPADKLSFYEKADRDSLLKEEFMRNDPYYTTKEDSALVIPNELELITQNTAGKYNQRLTTSPYETSGNSPEQKIMQKLALLNREMNTQTELKVEDPLAKYQVHQQEGFSDEVNRLENMMQVMNKPGDEDTEMLQLNGTLEKILDIQHPQRLKDRLKEKSLQQKEVVFAVSGHPAENNISLLDTVKRQVLPVKGFYGIEETQKEDEENNAIEAVVHTNQSLINGAVIKLRLTTDIYINGRLLSKGNFLFGLVSLHDERLEIEVNSIRNNNSLFPVKLEVYDMDGQPGIYIPGAITRDIAKQSADNGLQLMELTSVDPTLKAQIAAAGISTVKNLLSKKVKQVKVLVKAGYKVFLKNKTSQQ